MYQNIGEKLAGNPLFRFLFLIRKVYFTRASKRYYSQYGEEIGLDRVLNLKEKGFYVDVGCYHPVKYSNTYKLYRRGWRGINVDLDSIKIQAFNMRRPGDINVVAAVSEKEGKTQLCSTGFYTLTQSIDQEMIAGVTKAEEGAVLREVETRTLTNIIDQTKFKGRRIDVLSVDVEGHELSVLKALDFERYAPKVIIVELHKFSLEEVLESALYVFLKKQGYNFFNWTGPSLLFKHAAI